jgi:hypothetical protein
MKDQENLFEFWKDYMLHVKNPRNIIFYLYWKEMFNGLLEFYHFSCQQLTLMGDFILASQMLKKAENLM